jgi:hypothetical protein
VVRTTNNNKGEIMKTFAIRWNISSVYVVEAETYEEAENFALENEMELVLEGTQGVGISIDEIEEVK